MFEGGMITWIWRFNLRLFVSGILVVDSEPFVFGLRVLPRSDVYTLSNSEGSAVHS